MRNVKVSKMSHVIQTVAANPYRCNSGITKQTLLLEAAHLMTKTLQACLILLSATAILPGCTEDQMALNSRTNPTETSDSAKGDGHGHGGHSPSDDVVVVKPAPASSDEAIVLQLTLDHDMTGSP